MWRHYQKNKISQQESTQGCAKAQAVNLLKPTDYMMHQPV
jgi:hypothetical protein